ncbi:MAG: PAS domain S-box protein [Candidatus Magnetominusculus sp. LBB02]|nr:PAS domain S-box protein [Candidatus Magnetominusculus sp. LBB02]
MKINEYKRALNALIKCNKVIRRNSREQLLLRELCKVIVKDAGYTMAWIGYKKEDDEDKHVVTVSSYGFDDGYIQIAEIVWSETERGLGPTGTCIRSGKIEVSHNMTTDERLKPWKDEAIKRGYASSIALPIIINDIVIGSLTIYAAEPDAFDNDEVELLRELIETLSFGISHIRQNKSLIESEERYKNIFDGTILPILIINPETLQLKDVNEKACQFYGYSKDKFIKMRLPDIQTLPEERLKTIAFEVVGKKRSFLTTRHRTASGEIKAVEIYIGPIKICGKDYICSTVHDVTERQAIEEQVNLSTEILNNMSEGVSLIRAADGVIAYANPRFEKMAGYAHDELIGKHISVINAPTDMDPMEKARAIMKELTETGKWQGQIENIKKDGTTFWCYATVSTFEHGRHGTVWVTIHNDITDRLKTQERCEKMMDVSIDGFTIVDMEGTLIKTNKAFSKMLGYTEEELSHMKIMDIEVLETPEEIQRRIKRMTETGGDRFESKHRHKDGRVIDVEVSVNFIKSNNLLFSFIRDITQRKAMQEEIERQNVNLQRRVEEEVEKNREKDRLMYEQSRHVSMGELLMNISHHWRQPLCAVAISVQDIRDAYLHNELDDAYLNNNIELAMSELKILSETIDNFRNFYVTAKDQKEFNIAGEINRAESLILGYAKENGIVVDKALDESLTALGYPDEFAHVVLNILTNAKDRFERIDPIGGIIRIRLYKDEGTGRNVITIANNGGEIPSDIINKVFDPYFTTKEKTRGSGMGLYMAKVIIEKNMNGAISAINNAGWCELRIEL